MTSPTPPPSCPDCRAPLTGAASCPACGLRLTGPSAARLWEVDVALAGLDVRRGELLTERGHLLTALRPGAVSTAAPDFYASSSVSTGVAGATVAPAAATSVDWMLSGATPAPARQEWTPQRVQNTLLGLGALLLTVAAIVFAAVTYDRLGAAGRAAVLVLLTAVAGLAVPRLKARGLAATAETVTAVTLALGALDAYGLRTLGLAQDSSGSVYAAGSAAVLAVLSGVYAAAVPVRLPRFAAVVLAHLPVPLLLVHAGASAGQAGLALALVAAVDVAALALLDRRPARDVQLAVVVMGLLSAVAAVMSGTAGAFLDGRTEGALALVTVAATSACAALLTPAARGVLSALPAPMLAVAAVALTEDGLTEPQRPLVLAAVALVAMQATALLPRSWRSGPVGGALLVAVGAVATQAEAVAQAVALPMTWLAEPWTRVPTRDARHALSPLHAWDGTVVTLVVVAAAAVTAAGAGLALHRIREAAVPAAALGLLAIVVLPLGLATSYPLALVLLLGATIALLTVGSVDRRFELALAAGLVTALLTATWASADETATLLVLPVLALAFAAVALRRAEAAGVAAVAAGAFVAAGAASRGLSADQVGGLLLVVPAVLVALTFALEAVRRVAVELAAAALSATSIVLATGDAGWLSWTLAGTGLLVLADALHADRRVLAAGGALLLSASSWVRLADAHITAPEPYVVPIGLAALLLGWLRARRAPQPRSWAAYGPGLSALLVPSLVASFDDATATRALLLALAAAGVLLVGAQARLQAPVVLGGAVLAVDALQLLAPYAAALPRWMTLGAVGLLLVTVGATYEQRRQDLARARQRFDALA